jgi:hypothetical protein
MNRRGFLNKVLRSGVAAAILPSALTYSRQWVITDGVYVPEGFVLECIPWQDEISRTLTAYIESVKRNLTDLKT